MSIYGAWTSAVIALGETVSAAADLGRDFEYLEIVIPTQTSATIGLQVGTNPAGGALAYKTLGIGSNVTAATTGNCVTTLELGGYRHVKVVSGTAQDAAETYYVRGYRL